MFSATTSINEVIRCGIKTQSYMSNVNFVFSQNTLQFQCPAHCKGKWL